MNETARIRDPEQTRVRILDAAQRLFVERGQGQVSMRELAQASGVTKSLIHHHFGSKESLWQAVKDRMFAAYGDWQKRALQEGPADAALLRDSVAQYFRFLRAHPEFPRLLSWCHLEGDSSCARDDLELIELGAERLREAQQHGEVRGDLDPLHIMITFIAVSTQWFQAREHYAEWRSAGDAGALDDEAFLDDFLAIFFEGVTPRA